MLQSSSRGLALLNASACLDFILGHDDTTGNMGLRLLESTGVVIELFHLLWAKDTTLDESKEDYATFQPTGGTWRTIFQISYSLNQ